MQPDQEGREKPKRWLSLVGTVIGLIAIGVVVMLFMRPDDKVDGAKFELRLQRSVAALENQGLLVPGTKRNGYDLAEEGLEKLRSEFPQEPSVLRNLAVLSTLKFEDPSFGAEQWTEAQRSEYSDQARLRFDQLANVGKDRPLSQFLRARVLLAQSGSLPDDAIVSLLSEAAESRPEELAFWGLLVESLAVVLEDPETSDAWKLLVDRAVVKALELDPKNIYLLDFRLQQQLAAQDPTAVQTVERLEEVIGPLWLAMKRPDGPNSPLVQLASLKSHVQAGDWRQAAFAGARTSNSLKNEELGLYTNDRARATGHPLDFVAFRPSPELASRFAKHAATSPAKVRVTWETPQPLVETSQAVVDLVVADFNLDRTLDLALLDSQQLSVHLTNEQGKVTQVLSLSLPAGFNPRKLIAVDLDQDDKAKLTGAEDSAAMGQMGEMPGEQKQVDPSLVYFEADPDFMVLGQNSIAIILNADDKGADRHLEWVDQGDALNFTEIVDFAAFDLDHDSDCDLAVATSRGMKILLNNGAGVFTDVSGYSSLEPTTWNEGVQVVDWDRDLDLDLIGCDGSRLYLIENVHYGRFRQRPLEELGTREGIDQVLVWEGDGEPSWDVVLRQSGASKVALTRTTAQGVTIAQERDCWINLAARPRTEDLDNDGVQDLVQLFNGKLEIARGVPEGGFERGEPSSDAIAFDVIDWDGDGRLDVIFANSSGIQWQRNATSSGNEWWSLRAVGGRDQTGRVPRDGVGTLVELLVGGRYQAKVVRGQRTHLGLGNNLELGAARLIWTNGMPQSILEPKRNTAHGEPVFLKGSCPFVYTWDGTKFVFVTDCLWAAPVGLSASRTELVPSREWEYLKIPGALLQADSQGQYRVMLTEELWEAAYFDHVRLIAVDHPNDVRIESNEKVGPPSIAQYKIHTITQPRSPSGAWSTTGEDVSAIVAQADGNFYRGFEQRIVQGLTEEHFLELDLGDLSQAKQVTLFLTGWLHPTDSSLNVSFTDHPTRVAPRAPEIQVRDEAGNWIASPVPMGFPGGKTKTIAVDLSHLMPRADGRLRIVTTAEIYWDEVFFTVDEAPAEVQTTTMEVESAVLEYRGFSAREPKAINAPERFDYSQVDTNPWWPPMGGRFTRYGQVTELVQGQDHRMVVMGSGDQLALVFQAPEQGPPEGWTRDFLLYSVGWDKDADLNTMQGQFSEPLPFSGMTRYPYGPDEMSWETDELKRYQTEYLNRHSRWFEFWNSPFRTKTSIEP